VQRNDRRHRGEAELEAGTGERFRSEQEDDKSSHRYQPEADRVAPQRESEKDEQRRDAAAHRWDLGSGEQV
jgi:hypothetical protein